MGQDHEVAHPRKSVRALEDTIHSVMGLKANLTPDWAESVCCIVNNLASTEKSRDVTAGVRRQESKEVDILSEENANTSLCVENIRGEIADFSDRLRKSNKERQRALNELLDLKGNIRVFCRVRPFLPYENYNNPKPVLVSDSNNVCINITGGKRKQYTFDRVFQPSTTQEEVFSEIEPMIKSALDGYNICIFAYGQTGTGKTYSMEGRLDSPGIVPRAMKMLFGHALQGNQTLHMTFSMLEIYMGSLQDLLVPRRDKLMIQSTPCLSIQTDPDGGIDIENLITIKVNNFTQVKHLYRAGMRSRTTASTLSNATSSRSHCLIRISITCLDAPERRRKTNKIWLVDLGGSERLLKTQAKGRQLEEGKAINLSLSALADVISALQERKPHVPYRNNKLTQVLGDSLGEDSKALMFVHVSPKQEDSCETVCSLCFATRVRSTHLGNKTMSEARKIKETRISQLLEKLKHYESECEGLTRSIRELTEIMNNLNGSQCNQQSSVLCGPNEEQQSDMKVDRQITRDHAHVLKGFPGYMRATICSQRKLFLYLQNKESPRRKICSKSNRRKSSVYTETVIQSAKSNVSRTSSFEEKCGLHTETECSQDALDCEIKTMIHAEQKIPNNRSVTPIQNQIIFTEKSCISQVIHEERYHTVDNWIQIYSQKNKRVIAVPFPERYKQPTEEYHSIGNTEADISSSGAEQLGLGLEFHSHCSCKDLHHGDNNGETTEVSAGNSSAVEFAEDVLMLQMTDKQPKSQREAFLMPKTLLGSKNHTLLTCEEVSRTPLNKITDKDSDKYFGGHEKCGVKIRTMGNLLKSQRILQFPDELGENHKNVNLNVCKMPSTNQELHQTKGVCQLLGQIIQIFLTSILLGFGLKSLGLGHKFFQGLTI